MMNNYVFTSTLLALQLDTMGPYWPNFACPLDCPKTLLLTNDNLINFHSHVHNKLSNIQISYDAQS